MKHLYILIAQSAPKYTTYKVDIDPQFVIPVFYLVPLVVCVLMHRYSPKILGTIASVVFTLSTAYLSYVLYYDYAIWKYVMPIVAILGGLSGMSGWVRFLLKKVKNIGDDDSYFG
ncbi:hypothetical protein KDA00_01310 [Candidatus Saccharibacteria bacterium]|nr:hypothetical protein [Candidatus Saccharibacteria bacterium]